MEKKYIVPAISIYKIKPQNILDGSGVTVGYSEGNGDNTKEVLSKQNSIWDFYDE